MALRVLSELEQYRVLPGLDSWVVLDFARPSLARSTVVSGSSGSATDGIRTSDGMFIITIVGNTPYFQLE